MQSRSIEDWQNCPLKFSLEERVKNKQNENTLGIISTLLSQAVSILKYIVHLRVHLNVVAFRIFYE